LTAEVQQRRRPVAYLTGEYPKASHTFIQREVAALRRRGLRILTCSIRRTEPSEHIGDEEREAARTTFYVLPATMSPVRSAVAHLSALARSPRTYLSALALAVRTRPPGWRGALFQLFYFCEAVVLARHLRKNGVRRLHNHFADSSCTVAMLASALAGVPFSFTMHGPTEFFAAERWRLDVKAARAVEVFCISHFCRSQLMIFTDPADWPKLRIVRCGVDVDRYAEAERARTSRTDGAQILFIGRLTAVKGAPVLLDAFAIVRRAHPDATLTLIGDGPDRTALEGRVARLGLRDAVRFTGYLSQAAVAERLAEADIFVLPSFAEGVPIVLMEAMASAKPVIASRIAGIPELVEHGVSGWLTPPGDVAALAESMERLLANPDQRHDMGVNGRLFVRSRFNLELQADDLFARFSDDA
jgi:glycosyltransferase involved in cell wall biosynthesis